jgi:Phospholipase_D-nuclease N-terminal
VPLYDIFWTTLLIAGFGLAVWFLWVVLRDVFERDDLSAGAKVGWTLAACIFPIVGGLAYLATRSAAAGEVHLGAGRRRSADIYR